MASRNEPAGNEHGDQPDYQAQLLDAVAANGAYVLGCAREEMRVSVFDDGGEYSQPRYFADGCGERVVYVISYAGGRHFEMISRFSTRRGSGHKE